jgi:integrase
VSTRSRSYLRPNAAGCYCRQLGWELSRNGKLQQHKFALGTDLKEAQRRERRLRELWDLFEESQKDSRPLWPEHLLDVAKRIAKGDREVPVERKPDETQITYAGRIQRLQSQYPVVAFVPADRLAYEVGRAARAKLEAIPIPEDLYPLEIKPPDGVLLEACRAYPKLAEMAGFGPTPRNILFDGPPPDGAVAAALQRLTFSTNGMAPQAGAKPGLACSGMLHQALRDYQKWVKEEYYRPELGRLTQWGHTQLGQVDRLIHHHPDRPLSTLDEDGVDELIGYWRRRPLTKTKKAETPVTPKSASNFIAELRRFFRWLHRSPKYDWQRPPGFEDISTRVAALPTDKARSLEQVATFSLDELVLLMRYGRPMERLLLLLGLNCGFGIAEIASLQIGEVHLREAHEPRYQEILGFETTNQDSFIKRVRRKNGVYGEHLLFPMTVRALEWALKRRRRQCSTATEAPLLLDRKGEPYDKPSKSGHRNEKIATTFFRLIGRIRDDGNEIGKLSFGKLRKTAGDLIRRFSDGETMAVFHCRGRAVKTDDLADVYSNRPFGKVFQAIREVESYLAPVFKAAGRYAFDPQPPARNRRKTIERIRTP